jgi:hypothetical protein
MFMQTVQKILISILILASIGLVIGNTLSHSVESRNQAPSIQINQTSLDPALASANGIASEKVFVGSIKSNKYHYPGCSAAQKIKPENEIWFSSSADARAHGYVPCKICNPP